MKKLFIISSALSLILLLVFFLLPNSQELLSFSGVKFLAGEFYRLLTFSFVHITLNHLIENVVALALVTFLGFEFGLRSKEFVTYFLATSLVIALGDAFLFPLLVIAGASLGIYGILGVLSIKGSNFISKKVLIPILIVSIFYKVILNVFTSQPITDLEQTLFHLSSFLAGIILIIIPRFKKKKYILSKGKWIKKESKQE